MVEQQVRYLPPEVLERPGLQDRQSEQVQRQEERHAV